jgi:PleD family two-component response regulator
LAHSAAVKLPNAYNSGIFTQLLYSEVGEGTTVKIYLPRHLGAADATETEIEPDAAGAIGMETILVVEDDDALRAYATEILRELGYWVLEAANGASALKIPEGGQDIDLLFSDVVMPGGINGCLPTKRFAKDRG